MLVSQVSQQPKCLATQGVGAVLLEAKSEVGGRTYSERLDGAVIERGAEFYHPDHHARVVQRMAAFGLPAEPLPQSAEVTWLCESGEARRLGDWDSVKGSLLSQQINRDAGRFDSSLWWSEEAAVFDISWQDYLDQLEGDEGDKRRLKALLHTLTGCARHSTQRAQRFARNCPVRRAGRGAQRERVPNQRRHASTIKGD